MIESAYIIPISQLFYLHLDRPLFSLVSKRCKHQPQRPPKINICVNRDLLCINHTSSIPDKLYGVNTSITDRKLRSQRPLSALLRFAFAYSRRRRSPKCTLFFGGILGFVPNHPHCLLRIRGG